jgi:hypothetical protein
VGWSEILGMIVLIAAYSGVTDITAVVTIVGANVAMILFGWIQERTNPPGRTSTNMQAFWFGTIAGLALGGGDRARRRFGLDRDPRSLPDRRQSPHLLPRGVARREGKYHHGYC